MAEIECEIKGTTCLVMHNGELADPDSEHAQWIRELSKKRNKSPEERAELGRREWQGGLYFREDVGPGIPDQNILATVVEGARRDKMGKEVEALVSISEPFVKLDYKGPRDFEGMWKAGMMDRRTVSLNGRPGGPKGVRVRPLFKEWSLSFVIFVDDDLDPGVVVEALKTAGKRVGLCERKKFRWGRFEVVRAMVKK